MFERKDYYIILHYISNICFIFIYNAPSSKSPQSGYFFKLLHNGYYENSLILEKTLSWIGILCLTENFPSLISLLILELILLSNTFYPQLVFACFQ